jgi:recombinational DNA repair ATPase RecF
MPVKIKTINIHGFRGIPDLEMELEGKSLILQGENGTGKSSIVEAIEFFFTGKVSHLEGVRGLSLRRHAPHVSFAPNDVNVTITFDPGNVSLSRTFTAAPSPPAPLKEYFKGSQKGTFILRRLQILEFIMSQPATRFRVIGSIIGIEQLDEVELEMMRLRDELEGKVASKREEISKHIRDLSGIVGKHIVEVNDVVPALNKILLKAGFPSIWSLEEVDRHAQEMLKAVRKTEIINRVGALNEIIIDHAVPFISQGIIDELDEINEKVRHLLRDQIRVELSVANLLESGRIVIEQERMDICPLCEQRIDRKRLLFRINDRLRIFRDLSDKASEIRKISIPVIDDLRVISDKIKSTISKTKQFTELSAEKEMLLNKLAFLDSFIAKVESAMEIINEIPIQELIQHKDEINQIENVISSKCSGLLVDIGLTEEEKKVLEIVRLIEQARSRVKDLSIANSDLRTHQKHHKHAERIYSKFSEVKRTKIQEIYDSIQEDIDGFYSKLHPNEAHKNVEVSVALGKRASTELKIESFGRGGEDPRALTSEGHLDSLGLCIFLAFVKKFNADCSLIVLDDVVTTVDARHRKNICKLLFEEFLDKQLIITTHDGIWYEQLRASQRAYGIEGNFKNLTIVKWQVDTGPIIRPHKSKWEKIQDKIAAGYKTGAGNDGRQYLEWILERICETIQVPVVFKSSGRYEVGELLIPAKKRLGDLIRDGAFKVNISKAFKDLESTIILGNILSHNNILTEEVSIEEVKSFCYSVRNLHFVFSCPNCKHFIGYYHDLQILRCSNPRCKNPIEVKTK